MATGMPTAMDKAQYAQWFREADKDRNGYLTNKEMKKMFKAKGYKMSGKQFKRQFSSLDRDGDKKVSLEEYLIAMGQVPEINHREAEIRAAFEKADKNGDGVLDLDEMKDAMRNLRTGLTSKQIFDIIHKADKQKTGKISYEDFILIYLREQGVFDD